ncbi:MAG: alpha-galactosidase, partial [Verrucomicrobiota bacterium]|nr:alpha-galactosidase [Verrucomicrobiota bacterium]
MSFAAALVLAACGRAQVRERPGSRVVLTPPPLPTPRINGPKIYGARPHAPFLFQIAATGERPMRFAANDLPPGLSLDGESGQITGAVAERGRHVVKLRAENAHGAAERPLTIVIGEEIALTPAMGWNSWNVWGGGVTQARVEAAARALVASGLRDHGWSYINIDDGWQGKRGGSFNAIQPNAKFPEMGALANEVHSLGLKLGIYSSPWRTTFNYNIGSYADAADGRYNWIESGSHNEFFHFRFAPDGSWISRQKWLSRLSKWQQKRNRARITRELRSFGEHSFVRQDVAQWAEWGVDYLKYDWVPVDVAHTAEMHDALTRCGRDIVYSVSNNTPPNDAAQIAPLVNSWRTSSDVMDNWEDASGVGFTRGAWAKFQQPGHFNDPDMLVLGEVGWGQPRPTKLTGDEQYTHMSLWCLLGGPLLLGCDLEKLDPFTLGLLTNDEVLEINQDSLGKQALRIAGTRTTDVFAKPLEDGSWAVGLFNRGASTARVAVNWKNFGGAGSYMVRDLWRQQDLGIQAARFESEV